MEQPEFCWMVELIVRPNRFKDVAVISAISLVIKLDPWVKAIRLRAIISFTVGLALAIL